MPLRFYARTKELPTNCLFPRILRQLRAQTIMYALYTQPLRAVLPSVQKNILINQSFPNQGRVFRSTARRLNNYPSSYRL